MKIDSATFERMRDAIIPAYIHAISQSLYKTRHKLAAEKLCINDMWTIASRSGCLTWLYDTPQKLNDDHIETALVAIMKQIKERANGSETSID